MVDRLLSHFRKFPDDGISLPRHPDLYLIKVIPVSDIVSIIVPPIPHNPVEANPESRLRDRDFSDLSSGNGEYPDHHFIRGPRAG